MRMNLIKLVLIFGLTLFGGEDFYFPEAASSVAAEEVCTSNNSVFAPGEKIVYKIYYNWSFVWIAAGELVFRVEDMGDTYHISASGRTYKSYDWVFKVRDYYDSYIEKETLRPKRTIRKVLEGNYTLYDDVTYHHDQAVAISKKGKTQDNLNTEAVTLAGCTHDILSSIYLMRNMDFSDKSPGFSLPMNIYLDRKVYSLDVVYAGADDSKRVKGLGPRNTLLFRPKLVVGNIFKDNEGMKVWVSDDENKIPLMIESPISVGSVKAVLTEHSGLKYPTMY
jgi:hypothetical protein